MTSKRGRKERERIPNPGEPYFMAWIAELSEWFGSLEQAFQWVREHPNEHPAQSG